MKFLASFVGAALVGALALVAAPDAQAQVTVTVNIGAPAWGPRVPYGTQYYYIPEIDGYYDLYSRQYIVYDDGYWVPLPQLYGYDPYRFHPVVIQYRGREPWCQRGYYHQRYAYQPYRNYGPSRGGYYGNGYGYNNGYGRPSPRGGYYNEGRGNNDHDRDDRGRGYGGGYSGGYNPPRDPQPGGYNPGRGQGQGGGHGGGQGEENHNGGQGQQGGGQHEPRGGGENYGGGHGRS